MRIDKYLVEKGYFETRTKALNAIKAEAVYVDGQLITKASYLVEEEANIEIITAKTLPYVSRGGLKLLGAIKQFKLDFKDKVVLDIGSSTGGFTDCSLQAGAKKVYAVDVGTNQLHPKLLADERVEAHQNTNILSLPKFSLPIDIVLMDASFVSVSTLLPALNHYVNFNNYLILLIKPQFEVGHIRMKNGIVKNSKQHLQVLESVSLTLNSQGLYINEIMLSPITGGDGNKEFLAKISRMPNKKIDFLTIIK